MPHLRAPTTHSCAASTPNSSPCATICCHSFTALQKVGVGEYPNLGCPPHAPLKRHRRHMTSKESLGTCLTRRWWALFQKRAQRTKSSVYDNGTRILRPTPSNNHRALSAARSNWATLYSQT